MCLSCVLESLRATKLWRIGRSGFLLLLSHDCARNTHRCAGCTVVLGYRGMLVTCAVTKLSKNPGSYLRKALFGCRASQ